MIEYPTFELIQKHGPRSGVAVCLGHQLLSNHVAGYYPNETRKFFLDHGYSDYIDLDYNGEAARLHDLNQPLPEDLFGIASLVFDGGVLEHVANPGEGFKSIVRLLKPGGVIVQTNPVNCYGASYYGISPEFQRDFYGANGIERFEQFAYVRRNIKLWALCALYRWFPPSFCLSLDAWTRKHTPVLGKVLFKDSPRDVKRLPVCNRICHFYPPMTHVAYVGRKRRDVAEIQWPNQTCYPKAT